MSDNNRLNPDNSVWSGYRSVRTPKNPVDRGRRGVVGDGRRMGKVGDLGVSTFYVVKVGRGVND